MEFTQPVTFLVGENGSGKSTLLETIACAARTVTVGSQNAHNDPSLVDVQDFARHIRLTWARNTHKGFYLRAEDFFGFAKRVAQIQSELHTDLQSVEADYAQRSNFAKNQARMAYANELRALQNRYGEGLDSQSHGESFLKLFQARFVPDGLYLLDEPEAPLSPLRQLALLGMLKTMTAQKSQFIIATHSPILMAYPGAAIWHFENSRITPADYSQLEHVRLTRDFLNNPQAYLDELWKEE